MPRRAFSLIELLVVIGIISILIGLLFPALSKARDRGRATVCASNLRQMAAAAGIYAQDDAQHRAPFVSFPVFPSQLGVVDPEQSWVRTMRPYLDAKDAALCPSDQSPHWTERRPGMGNRLREVSFGLNAHVADPASNLNVWPGTPTFGGSTDELRQPASVIAFGETAETGPLAIGDFITAAAFDVPLDRAAYATVIADTRHSDRPQYSFWDGHVEACAPDDVYDPGSYDSNSGTGEWAANKFHPLIAR